MTTFEGASGEKRNIGICEFDALQTFQLLRAQMGTELTVDVGPECFILLCPADGIVAIEFQARCYADRYRRVNPEAVELQVSRVGDLFFSLKEVTS